MSFAFQSAVCETFCSKEMKYVEILNPSKSSCHGAVNSKAQTADRPKKSFSAARLGRKSDVAGQSELVAWREITHIFLWRSLISAFLSSSPTSMEEGQSNSSKKVIKTAVMFSFHLHPHGNNDHPHCHSHRHHEQSNFAPFST